MLRSDSEFGIPTSLHCKKFRRLTKRALRKFFHRLTYGHRLFSAASQKWEGRGGKFSTCLFAKAVLAS